MSKCCFKIQGRNYFLTYLTTYMVSEILPVIQTVPNYALYSLCFYSYQCNPQSLFHMGSFILAAKSETLPSILMTVTTGAL